MSQIGHNSGIAADQLRAFIERVERLEEEKQALTDDIKEIYSEAKSAGFDTKIMRKVVARRKMDEADRNTLDEMIELYEGALINEMLGS